MARNKPTKPLAEAPPEPDSSSEEEEPEEHSSTESDDPPPLSVAPQRAASSSSTEADDDDEDQQQQSPATPPPPFSPPSKKSTTKKPTTTTTTAAATPQSSSSEENKRESDSDDEPELPVSKLKSTSKPTSKPTSPPPKPRSQPTIAALPSDKRPSDTTSLDKDKPSKKPKKDTAAAAATTTTKATPLSPGPGLNEDGSKKLFQRVFSEEDEIEILKGLSDFKDRKGSDPLKNDDEFYGFIKKRVHAEVNKAQMNDKVRRLKRKFVNNAKNKKRKSLNDHESKLFELSKRIWEVKDEDDDADVKVSNGGGAVKENEKSSSKKSGKSFISNDGGKDNGVVVSVVGAKSVSRSKEEESEGGDGDGDEMKEDFRVGENEMKEVMRGEALRRMGEKGRNEIREIWRKVENAQLEVNLMRSQARVEENKRIMEALGLLKC